MQKGIIETVKSPLSVITIFTMIVEIAMTVTLLRLPSESQKIFIWFVMFFTMLLVSLFFVILYKKPAVLFSPGDYQEEGNYLRSIGSAKGIEELSLKVDQLEETCNTIQSYIDKVVEKTIPEQSSEIIDSEKRRLEELKFIHSLESNSLYAFLSQELNISYREIQQIISEADTAYQLADIIFKVTSNKNKQIRVSHLLESFPKVINDFDYLKHKITKGE